jgi:hypothetical protein
MNGTGNRVGVEYHDDAKIPVKILFFGDAFTYNEFAATALMEVKSPEGVGQRFFVVLWGALGSPRRRPKKTGPTPRT